LDYASGTVDRLAGFEIMVVAFLEPLLVALWIAVGSGRQRRSHFWARFVLASLALPALLPALIGVAVLRVLPVPDAAAKQLLTLAFFVGVIALMFVPGLLYRVSDPSSGSSDSDGGGGTDPGPPRPLPDGPRGDVPLLDADQARARVRDHHGPKFYDRKRRRPAHEPRRTPTAITD
jgi:hypothetical protein